MRIAQKILALDIGGNKIKASVLDHKGKLLQKYMKADTPKHARPAQVLEAIQNLVKRFPKL